MIEGDPTRRPRGVGEGREGDIWGRGDTVPKCRKEPLARPPEAARKMPSDGSRDPPLHRVPGGTPPPAAQQGHGQETPQPSPLTTIGVGGRRAPRRLGSPASSAAWGASATRTSKRRRLGRRLGPLKGTSARRDEPPRLCGHSRPLPGLLPGARRVRRSLMRSTWPRGQAPLCAPEPFFFFSVFLSGLSLSGDRSSRPASLLLQPRAHQSRSGPVLASPGAHAAPRAQSSRYRQRCRQHPRPQTHRGLGCNGGAGA